MEVKGGEGSSGDGGSISPVLAERLDSAIVLSDAGSGKACD